MNKFGLPDSVLQEIISELKKYPEITQVKVFGSRAKGNFKRYSDIDLALFANSKIDIAMDIKDALEELDIIYRFDVLHYEFLKSEALKQHIDRVGIPILN